MSLLRSLVADVESSVVPYHTIVEVYRVAPHMPLMRVLPSAVDEVNAALFHPFKASPAPQLTEVTTLSPYWSTSLFPDDTPGQDTVPISLKNAYGSEETGIRI